MDNQKKKILLIEDDIFLGDVLLQKLTKDGFETTLERDGALGFNKIKEIKPNLVLLDIVLPNMNGYEVLEAKQKDPEISSIPVIIISNSGQPVEINRALALGVKDYLVKAQFDPEEVLVKVRHQLLHEHATNDTGLGAGAEHKNIDLSGKKVMWVEDDKFLNDIITRKLSGTKCNFIHASNGEEALDILNKETPDIIVLDVLLPGIDGFEILKKIKTEEKTKHIPVIMLSNLGQKSDIDKGKQLGAEQFFVKATVTLDEIVDEIKHLLSEKK